MPYLAVRNLPTDHFFDPGFDARNSGAVYRWPDGYETELFPAGDAAQRNQGELVLEVSNRSLVLI